MEHDKEKQINIVDETEPVDLDIDNRLKRLEVQAMEREKITFNYILGRKITSTSDASAGTQSTHPHTLGKVPKFVFITQKGNGVVYLSIATDATNIYIKASANSITFEAFCIL